MPNVRTIKEMAATKKVCKFARWKWFTVIIGFSIVIGALALYISSKLSIMRKQKNGTQLDTEAGLLAAAYQHFSSILKLGNDKTEFSFLDKEFYIFLWELVLLDIKDITSALHYCLLLHHELKSFIVVTVILILIVLLIRTFTQKYPKNRGASRLSKTRQNKNERPDSQDSVGFCCESHDCIERVKSRTKLYWWQLAVAVLGVSMLMSVPWEFVRLYKMKVAEKVAVVQSKFGLFLKVYRNNVPKPRDPRGNMMPASLVGSTWVSFNSSSIGIPPECVPEQMSFLQVFHSWLQWLFSWDTDQCEKYHRSLLVDPLWEIPPLLVVTTAFIHCILHPMELLFSGMGRSFRLFFKEIPTQWQPIMLFVLWVFLFLFLVMLFGYRIKFPFLLKDESFSWDKKQNCICKKRVGCSQISQESIQGSQENN